MDLKEVSNRDRKSDKKQKKLLCYGKGVCLSQIPIMVIVTLLGGVSNVLNLHFWKVFD